MTCKSSSMHDERVEILENKKINSEYQKLVFSSAKLAKNVKPGQFLNVRIENSFDPFWRRPFSYFRVKGSRIEILYEVLGRGTHILASKRSGDEIKILGPLGNGFSQNIGERKRILVAGGIGVPPLVFLAEKLKLNSKSAVLLVGCGNKSEVLPKRELSKVSCEIRYATDDGSYGKKGFVTALLETELKKDDPEAMFLQTCGPIRMMAEVLKLANRYGVKGEMSIDEKMGCGIGTCLGCVVETKNGFKTSCKEGPVFSFDELMPESLVKA